MISDNFSDITALPLKKQRRPLALGESLYTEIQKQIHALWLAGTSVRCTLVLAAAEGVVVCKDERVRIEYGGHNALAIVWALFLLR